MLLTRFLLLIRIANEWVGILIGKSYGPVYGSYTTGQVSGNADVGGLAGYLDGGSGNAGAIKASYSTAAVSGNAGSNQNAGGLVGRLVDAPITASYATGRVTTGGLMDVGGLVGDVNGAAAFITASYATGAVSSGGFTGGLVGRRYDANSVSNSYYDSLTTGQSDTGKGDPYTTAQRQEPTGYDGIYSTWNVDVVGDSNSDDPWDFGGIKDYPVLRVDFNDDGTATWQEFGIQRLVQVQGVSAMRTRDQDP